MSTAALFPPISFKRPRVCAFSAARPPRTQAATYKYRLWLNDQLVGQGEVILREK
jgi:hypothetical protein